MTEYTRPGDGPADSNAQRGGTVTPFPEGGYEFALCLTHDVDRPYKSIQGLYYALRDLDAGHLKALFPDENPWWTFDCIRAIERDCGVRSAFYFLQEPHLLRERSPREWLQPYRWIEHVGRYDPASPEIASLIRELDSGGWEIGLHGSLGTHRDFDRLCQEKEHLEMVLDGTVYGGRQHHLRHDSRKMWRQQSIAGLLYDTSLGSSDRVGFQYGYGLRRPFDDDFVVFPLTIMDKALMDHSSDPGAARRTCSNLLEEAREHNAVMTVLWHPRFFSELGYPGQKGVYRFLIERALEMDAWVGSPLELYRQYLHPPG